MTKLIVLAVLIIGVMVFFATYEGFNLLYYEENTADRYATYGAVPVLLYFFASMLVSKYRSSLKDNKMIDAIKFSLGGTLGLAVGYYFLMIPVLSGAIILTNDIFGKHNPVLVTGTVVGKTEVKGLKLSEYEIIVRVDEEIIAFDTNKPETDKYKIGDPFSQEMKRGCWNLLTKDK